MHQALAVLAPVSGISVTCNSTDSGMSAHRPVMLQEVLAGLAPRAGGIYMDLTFGRGGHSEALLQQLGSDGLVIALDKDPDAVRSGRLRFGARADLHLHQACFSDLARVARDEDVSGRVAGVLFDLGVSSPQLDDAARGFSFLRDGPLDMRMDPGAGESAADWLAHAREQDIADVIFKYGEERRSRRIARAIVQARDAAPLRTTTQLADVVARALPGPRGRIHPATRTFQAIRIHVNRELELLPDALSQAVAVLAPGGRLAVIAFHSLEDRIAKRFLRDRSRGAAPQLRLVARSFPTAAEAAENPRARSAVLRVAERLP